MKNKCYKLSKLKKELEEKRKQGIKVLTWKLSLTKKRQIEELGYMVKPYLYSVETRTFYNVKSIKNELLKELHYAKKKGENYKVMELKLKDTVILDEYGIKYEPIRYKIYLK